MSINEKLQPNSHLTYKNGNRRITLWLYGEENGLVSFSVNIKQASKNFSAGSGKVDQSTGKQFMGKYDYDLQEYIDGALNANS